MEHTEPKHKPSPKLAVDDVLSSLQDLVRNELADDEQAATPEPAPSARMGGGKVMVTWKIGPGGKVIGARVTSNSLSGGARVGSCISRSIRRWRFPSSSGYAVVRFPFLFSSGLK